MSVVVRCRKDLVLCKRAPGKGRHFYGLTKFTPEEVRRRDARARWQKLLPKILPVTFAFSFAQDRASRRPGGTPALGSFARHRSLQKESQPEEAL